MLDTIERSEFSDPQMTQFSIDLSQTSTIDFAYTDIEDSSSCSRHPGHITEEVSQDKAGIPTDTGNEPISKANDKLITSVQLLRFLQTQLLLSPIHFSETEFAGKSDTDQTDLGPTNISNVYPSLTAQQVPTSSRYTSGYYKASSGTGFANTWTSLWPLPSSQDRRQVKKERK